MMDELDIDTENGYLSVEPRSNGGIGIYQSLNEDAKGIVLMLSRDEMLLFASWLISYIEANKDIIVGTKKG